MRAAQDAAHDQRVGGGGRGGAVEAGERRRPVQRDVAAEHRRGAREPSWLGVRAAAAASTISRVTRAGLCSAAAPAQRPPSPAIAQRASSRSRNGLPPVATWQAWHRASSAAGRDRADDGGGGRSRPSGGTASAPCAAGRAAPRGPAGLLARLATTRATAMPSRRLARWARMPSDAESAQCASSTSSASGAVGGEVGRQPVEPVAGGERVVGPRRPVEIDPQHRRGLPRRPGEQLGRVAARDSRTAGARPRRRTPRSSSAPRACSAGRPASSAALRAASSSVVLPTPAGPSITTRPPEPTAAWRRRARTPRAPSRARAGGRIACRRAGASGDPIPGRRPPWSGSGEFCVAANVSSGVDTFTGISSPQARAIPREGGALDRVLAESASLNCTNGTCRVPNMVRIDQNDPLINETDTSLPQFELNVGCYNAAIVTVANAALANRRSGLASPKGRTATFDAIASSVNSAGHFVPKALNQLIWQYHRQLDHNAGHGLQSHHLHELIADVGVSAKILQPHDPKNYGACWGPATISAGATFRDDVWLSRHVGADYVSDAAGERVRNPDRVLGAMRRQPRRTPSPAAGTSPSPSRASTRSSSAGSPPAPIRCSSTTSPTRRNAACGSSRAAATCARPRAASATSLPPVRPSGNWPGRLRTIPGRSSANPATTAPTWNTRAAGRPATEVFFIEHVDAISLDWQPSTSPWQGKWGRWTDFTSVRAGGQDHLLAYDRATGTAQISRPFDALQGTEALWQGTWGHWTHLVPFSDNGTDHLLTYNSDTRQAMISRFYPNLNESRRSLVRHLGGVDAPAAVPARRPTAPARLRPRHENCPDVPVLPRATRRRDDLAGHLGGRGRRSCR